MVTTMWRTATTAYTGSWRLSKLGEAQGIVTGLILAIVHLGNGLKPWQPAPARKTAAFGPRIGPPNPRPHLF